MRLFFINVKRFFWFTHADRLNIKGFFVCWVIENVELHPETRALIIRELLAMQRLDHFKDCSNGDGSKSDE